MEETGLWLSIKELAVVFDRSERQIQRWLKKWAENGHYVDTKKKGRELLYYLPHVIHGRELDLAEMFD